MDKIYNLSIYDCFLFFYFYSICGWAGESIYCSVLDRKITNRGFLVGPVCPIYGTGALAMLFSLGWIRPIFSAVIPSFWGEVVSFILVALIGALVCDVVEYITSFLMEKLFHERWWDYSNRKFNLHGRICLHHSVFWAIGAVFYVYILDPFIGRKILALVPDNLKLPILAILTFVMAVDLIGAIINALSIRNLIDKLKVFSENIKKLPDTFSESWKEYSEKFNSWRKDIPDQFKSLFESGKEKAERSSKQNRFFKNNKNFYQRSKQLFADAERKLEEIRHHFDDDEMM